MTDVPSPSNFPQWMSYLFGSGAIGLLTGALGYFSGRRKSNAEVGQIEAATEKTKIEGDAELSRLLDQHIKTLLQGYQQRIVDLTAEVHSLREEVKELRRALDERPKSIAQIGL